eukprot:m.279483 g.279483  ORF g.279483 m.279483 type:complete len:3125 (-) comp16159_c3_seq1:116-9490(-)
MASAGDNSDLAGAEAGGVEVSIVVVGGADVHFRSMMYAIDHDPSAPSPRPIEYVSRHAVFKDLDTVAELRGQDGRLKQWADHFDSAVDWVGYAEKVAEHVERLEEALADGKYLNPDGTPCTRGVVVVMERLATSRPGGWGDNVHNVRTIHVSATHKRLFQFTAQANVTHHDFNDIVWPQHCRRASNLLETNPNPDMILVDCGFDRDAVCAGFCELISQTLAGESELDVGRLLSRSITPADALRRVTGSNLTAKMQIHHHNQSVSESWKEYGADAERHYENHKAGLIASDDLAFARFADGIDRTMSLGTKKEANVWKGVLAKRTVPPEATPQPRCPHAIVGLLVAKCRELLRESQAGDENGTEGGSDDAARTTSGGIGSSTDRGTKLQVLARCFFAMNTLGRYYPVQFKVFSYPPMRDLMYQLLDAHRAPLNATALLRASFADDHERMTVIQSRPELAQVLGLKLLGTMCTVRGRLTIVESLMESDQLRAEAEAESDHGAEPGPLLPAVGTLAIDGVLSLMGVAELLATLTLAVTDGKSRLKHSDVEIATTNEPCALCVYPLDRLTGQPSAEPTRVEQCDATALEGHLRALPVGVPLAIAVALELMDADAATVVAVLRNVFGADIEIPTPSADAASNTEQEQAEGEGDGPVANVAILATFRPDGSCLCEGDWGEAEETAWASSRLHELLPETSDVEGSERELWGRYSGYLRESTSFSIRSFVKADVIGLFKGFPGHAKRITVQHVRRMWCLASLCSRRLHRPEHTAGLLTLLTQVLVYGTAEAAQWILRRRDAVQLVCDCAKVLRADDGYFTDEFDTVLVQDRLTGFLLRCLHGFSHRPEVLVDFATAMPAADVGADAQGDPLDGNAPDQGAGPNDPANAGGGDAPASVAPGAAAQPRGDESDAESDGSGSAGSLIASTYELLQTLRRQNDAANADRRDPDAIWMEEADRLQLQRHNAELHDVLSRREAEVSALKEELETQAVVASEKERLEADLRDLRASFDRLSTEHDKLQSTPSQLPPDLNAAPASTGTPRGGGGGGAGADADADHPPTVRDRLLGVQDPSGITEADARAFVEEIRAERVLSSRAATKLGSEARMMNGALEHLGENLYASPLHFFNEILQNAEDNTYPEGDRPELRLVLVEPEPTENADGPTEPCLIVSNNERGFLPKDVLSIASIASSSKQGGKFIGQKGLGFKSVFSVTAEPHVTSGPFCFSFGGRGAANAIDKYITPKTLDLAAVRARFPCGMELLKTTLYLPLKPTVPEDFHSQLVADVIDPLVLTTSNKLKDLSVSRVAKGVEEQITFRCDPCDLDTDAAALTAAARQSTPASGSSNEARGGDAAERTASADRAASGGRTISSGSQAPTDASVIASVIRDGAPIDFSDIPGLDCRFVPDHCRNVVLQVTRSSTAAATVTTHERYRVYHCVFNVPADCADPARPQATSTYARFVFPIDDAPSSRASYPVFAALPVMDVGLPFALDADWVLVTSRASVKESSRWNGWVRRCAAAVYAHLFMADPFLRRHMDRFRVTTTDRMPLWWRGFVHDVNDGVKRSFGPDARLLSATMTTLGLTPELLEEHRSITVVPATGEYYNTLLSTGMKPVTICDVLRCFGARAEGGRTGFDGWAAEQSTTWWADLFRLCNECDAGDAASVASLCRDRALFRIRPNVVPDQCLRAANTKQDQHVGDQSQPLQAAPAVGDVDPAAAQAGAQEQGQGQRQRQARRGRRSYLPPRIPEAGGTGLYVCADTSFESWRPECWTIVDAASPAEERLIATALQLPELTPETLCFTILLAHAELHRATAGAGEAGRAADDSSGSGEDAHAPRDQASTADAVWRDLAYLRDKLPLLDSMQERSATGHGSEVVQSWPQVLLAPTVGADGRPDGECRPIATLEIPLALGFPLPTSAFLPAASVMAPPPRCDFFGAVRWERFLRRCSGNQPEALAPDARSAFSGRLLPPLAEWPADVIDAAAEVLPALPTVLRNAVTQTPIVCTGNDHASVAACPVGTALDATAFVSALPHLDPAASIQVPPHARDLAQLLGVAVSKTPDACLNRVLRGLASRGVATEAPYLEWLWACTPDVLAQPTDAFSDVAIYMPDDAALYAIRDILVLDPADDINAGALRVMAAALNLSVLSASRNSAYIGNRDVLLALGSPSALSFRMCVDCAARLTSHRDTPESYRQNLGAELILTDAARDAVLEVYRQIERLLRAALATTAAHGAVAGLLTRLDDRPWLPLTPRDRDALTAAVAASGIATDEQFSALTDAFPVILGDSSVGTAGRVLLCDDSFLGSALRAGGKSTLVCFSELPRTSPVLCSLLSAMLGRPFLDQRSVVVWSPSETTREEELPTLGAEVASRLRALNAHARDAVAAGAADAAAADDETNPQANHNANDGAAAAAAVAGDAAAPTVTTEVQIVTAVYQTVDVHMTHAVPTSYTERDNAAQRHRYLKDNFEYSVGLATDPPFVLWEEHPSETRRILRLVCTVRNSKDFSSAEKFHQNFAAAVCLGVTQILAVFGGLAVAAAQREALRLVRVQGALSTARSAFNKATEQYGFLANVQFPLSTIDGSVYTECRDDLTDVTVTTNVGSDGYGTNPGGDPAAGEGGAAANAASADGDAHARPPQTAVVKERLEGVSKEYEELVREQLEATEGAVPPPQRFGPPVPGPAFSGVVDQARIERTGQLGELFFHTLLGAKFKGQYRPSEHWVSSNRLKCLANQSGVGVDDGLGYDFQIRDGLGFFLQHEHGKEITCHIEVKSTARGFDGGFHVSDNELLCCQRIAGAPNCAYILAFVEHVQSGQPRLAQIRVWSSDLKAVHLEPETYTASLGRPRNAEAAVDYTSVVHRIAQGGPRAWQARPAEHKRDPTKLERGDMVTGVVTDARSTDWVTVVIPSLGNLRVGLNRTRAFDQEQSNRVFRPQDRLRLAFEGTFVHRQSGETRYNFTARSAHFVELEGAVREYKQLQTDNAQLQARTADLEAQLQTLQVQAAQAQAEALAHAQALAQAQVQVAGHAQGSAAGAAASTQPQRDRAHRQHGGRPQSSDEGGGRPAGTAPATGGDQRARGRQDGGGRGGRGGGRGRGGSSQAEGEGRGGGGRGDGQGGQARGGGGRRRGGRGRRNNAANNA